MTRHRACLSAAVLAAGAMLLAGCTATPQVQPTRSPNPRRQPPRLRRPTRRLPRSNRKATPPLRRQGSPHPGRSRSLAIPR